MKHCGIPMVEVKSRLYGGYFFECIVCGHAQSDEPYCGDCLVPINECNHKVGAK